MNRFSNHFLPLLLAAVLAAITLSCVSFPVEYVPPDKIVYLRQPFYLVPVRYAPQSADPYQWNVEAEIDRVNPGILSSFEFQTYLRPDVRLDAKTYRETKEHLLLMKEDAFYNRLRIQLNSIKVDKPVPRKITKGDEIKKYSNATEYKYPEEAGATITFFNNKDVKIDFQDGRNYFAKSNGDFFENDAHGSELYAVFVKDDSFRVTIGDGVYSQSSESRTLTTKACEIIKTGRPDPQYAFRPAGKKYRYVFFVDDFTNEKPTSVALIHDKTLRYDYFFNNDSVMITFQEQESVVITEKNEKSHHYFNAKTRKAEEIYSYYFPEGIRIADLKKPLSYAEVSPNWPERYLERKIGPYRILYVKKDEPLLDHFDVKKLSETYAIVTKTTGINFSPNRVIILPPDLDSFLKLHAQADNEILSWYPSGFQTKDIIVMWPLSLPRYQGETGERYFWEKEMYEILSHELTHLAVGEVTGIFSPVPVWLNEGLAVYVEGRYSAEAKKYWDVTFDACLYYSKLLGWDDIAASSTSDYPVDAARTHYAQSYKMVAYLIDKYGPKNLFKYVVSFKVPMDKTTTVDIRASYKENFGKIFGTTWEENLAFFEKYCKEKRSEGN